MQAKNRYEALSTDALRHLGHSLVDYRPVVGSPMAICRNCDDRWTLEDTELLDSPQIGKPAGPSIVPQWHGPRRICPARADDASAGR